MLDEFKDISIRGRLAYGMICLENALRQFGIKDELLDNIILPRIWEFTSSSHLDDWEIQINEIDPTCVLDVELTADTFDLTTLSFNNYTKLLRLYKTLPNDIVELIADTIRIGVANIYAGTESYSPLTLVPLTDVFKTCKKIGLNLPSVETFKNSAFSESQGWGDERPREYFIKE